MSFFGDAIYSSRQHTRLPCETKLINSRVLEGRGPPQLTRDRGHHVDVAITHGQLGEERSHPHKRSSSGGGCLWHVRCVDPLGYIAVDGVPRQVCGGRARVRGRGSGVVWVGWGGRWEGGAEVCGNILEIFVEKVLLDQQLYSRRTCFCRWRKQQFTSIMCLRDRE